MTAEQHEAKAVEYLGYAHDSTGRDYQKAAMFAAIATAHAAIATAMRGGR